MECPHIDDIKEIKKDVKTLLAHMNQQKGATQLETRNDARLVTKVTLISIIIPLILGAGSILYKEKLESDKHEENIRGHAKREIK